VHVFRAYNVEFIFIFAAL